MRAFLSINLSGAIHNGIEAIQRKLRPEHRGIRWTAPERCHLTLKFLGDITEAQAGVLGEALRPAAEAAAPFALELRGMGAFPAKGPCSVVWIGASGGAAALTMLEMEVRRALEENGTPFDGKPFAPHVTIGRARRDSRVFFPAKRYETLAAGRMTVEAFHLMESILEPGGARHIERARFELGGGSITP